MPMHGGTTCTEVGVLLEMLETMVAGPASSYQRLLEP